jgi:hypothetical protein
MAVRHTLFGNIEGPKRRRNCREFDGVATIELGRLTIGSSGRDMDKVLFRMCWRRAAHPKR